MTAPPVIERPTAVKPPRAAVWRRIPTFASLKHRDYLLLWLGVNFASAGHWMEQVALGWLVYEMTDSPFVLGAVTGLRALPFLFLGPIAGVVADRYDRRAIMIWSQIAEVGGGPLAMVVMGAMCVGLIILGGFLCRR